MAVEEKNEQREMGWSGMALAVAACADWLEQQNVKAIHGIPRGGLVFATMLSYRTAIPLIERSKMKSLISSQLLSQSEILVVDDISDTGSTLKPYTEHGHVTAVLVENHDTATPSDWHYTRNDQNCWIVFPWESKQSTLSSNEELIKEMK